MRGREGRRGGWRREKRGREEGKEGEGGGRRGGGKRERGGRKGWREKEEIFARAKRALLQKGGGRRGAGGGGKEVGGGRGIPPCPPLIENINLKVVEGKRILRFPSISIEIDLKFEF